MSGDELMVTLGALLLGPLWWTVWLFQMARVRALHQRGMRLGPIALTLIACTVLTFVVLRTAASFDVVDAPQYQLMYVAFGLAWLRVITLLFPYMGLSPRDDAVERGNKAATGALVGALLGVTLCYAGGNIGDGPGWWVVLFSAALATSTLLLAWGALAQLTAVTDAVTIDRDPAAGLRLGTFLLSSGLLLGRGVAGDWVSATATVEEFAVVLPTVALILVFAIVIERLAHPKPERPQAPLLAWGILPAVLYLAIAINTVRTMAWPA